MPSIKDLDNIKKPNKTFEKKGYRPWDIKNDTLQNESSNNYSQISVESNVESFDLEKIWRYLYGAKKDVFSEILKNIEEIHDSHVITHSLTANQLTSNTSLPQNTIRAAIQRLKKDGLLFYYEKKPGKGGFARYLIPVHIYNYFTEKFSIDT